MYIKTQRYNVAVHQRTKLYACHTEKDSDDFETLTAEVSVNGKEYMLKNLSKNNWDVTGGDSSSVAVGTAIALKKGMTINFGLVKVEVI
jgi:hypothetical protein